MSTGGWLHHFGTVIKKPAVWLGSIFLAAATTYAANLLGAWGTTLSEKLRISACERWEKKPLANESQFTILVSPLTRDHELVACVN